MRPFVFVIFVCGVFFASPLSSFAQTDTVAVSRGRYLVNEVSKCGDCHTPRTRGVLDKAKWLKGTPLEFQPLSPIPGWATASADLTATGSLWKNWGEKGMVQFFVTGRGPDGKPAAPPMPQYTSTEQDARAIVAYLKTLP